MNKIRRKQGQTMVEYIIIVVVIAIAGLNRGHVSTINN